MWLVALVLCACALSCSGLASCPAVGGSQRVDCELNSQQLCESAGCCWNPINPNPQNYPWCFVSPAGSCAIFYNATGAPPFSSGEVAIMQQFFLNNLNYGGIGAVLASPDSNVNGGGSYRYHWSRDGALSMRTMFDTMLATNASTVYAYMMAYTKFIVNIHQQADPFGQSILTEPKFNLDGSVFAAGWCRPQNDGPALRAVTLIKFANYLLSMRDNDIVKTYLWTGDNNVLSGGAIKLDLDWIANQGAFTNTCDLWEEVREGSGDFFWNRMAHTKAMLVGSQFAAQQGDYASAARYKQMYGQLSAQLGNHWNGQYIVQGGGRQIDGAVLGALCESQMGIGTFAVTSAAVAATVATYTQMFCAAFPINAADSARGVPGVLIGRYPGDQYGSPPGNPWILLSAYLAQLFYLGAAQTRSARELPDTLAMRQWGRVFPGRAFASHQDFSAALVAAGDSVLTRIRYHVAGAGFHLNEQLNKYNGFENSAKDLTWSYASVLRAMFLRKQANEAKAAK